MFHSPEPVFVYLVQTRTPGDPLWWGSTILNTMEEAVANVRKNSELSTITEFRILKWSVDSVTTFPAKETK